MRYTAIDDRPRKINGVKSGSNSPPRDPDREAVGRACHLPSAVDAATQADIGETRLATIPMVGLLYFERPLMSDHTRGRPQCKYAEPCTPFSEPERSPRTARNFRRCTNGTGWQRDNLHSRGETPKTFAVRIGIPEEQSRCTPNCLDFGRWFVYGGRPMS